VIDAAPAAAWQVIQEPGRLRVLAAGSRPEFEPELVATRLRQAIQVQGAAVPEIMVEHVTVISRGASGKALLIKPLSPHVTA
jgi:hypothetical protein